MSYADQLKAIKPKPCPACGSVNPRSHPHAGKGTRLICRCGAITDWFYDPRDADIAWNAWVAKCHRIRKDVLE